MTQHKIPSIPTTPEEQEELSKALHKWVTSISYEEFSADIEQFSKLVNYACQNGLIRRNNKEDWIKALVAASDYSTRYYTKKPADNG